MSGPRKNRVLILAALVLALALSPLAAWCTGATLVESGGVVSVLVGLGAAVLSWMISKREQSLAEIVEFVGEVGTASREGERLPAEGRGGLAELRRSINQMADSLEAAGHRVERQVAQQRAILASMPNGVLAVDRQGRVVLANEAVRGLLEFAISTPEGELLEDVIRHREVLELAGRCLSEERAARVRAVVYTGSHRAPRVLEVQASPMMGSHEEGCVLVFEDRTELERLERVRRDFVANVSHELKTPLTSIRGYIETVREDPDLPAGMRDRFLDKSLRNADRLAAIVGDLLTLARAEGASGAPSDERVELAALATAVKTEELPLATEAGIRLEVDAPERVVVLGDRVALTSALSNLVENAIKYSPEGTSVRILVSERAGVARLEVEDQGPGIADEHLGRLFERFYRVDKDRSRELGGTGLGLSIVRHVARAHGGEARVMSTLGKGSRFWLELPTAGAAD